MRPLPTLERVEVILRFEDRRAADGLQLPYRIIQTARGVTFEEMQFDEIVVNPSLEARDFK